MATQKKFNPKAKTKKVPVKKLAKAAITLLGPGKFGVAAKAGTKAVKHLVKQAKAKKLGKAAVKKAKNNKTVSPYSNTKNQAGYDKNFDPKATRNYISKENKKIKSAFDYMNKNPRKNPSSAEEYVFEHREYIENALSNFAKSFSKTQMRKAAKKVLKK